MECFRILLPLSICSMLMISSCRQETAATLENPLERLMEGNQRFATMKLTHPHLNKKRVAEISNAQHPFAVVVCCSDSRVSPELLFDQGLGDLFVIRTAGNLMGGLELGSIEYAIQHLGVQLIVVMGHRQCGAIKAYVDGGEVSGHIRDIVDSIRSEEEICKVSKTDINRLDQCINGNILHGIRQLSRQSEIIADKISRNELKIVAACYNMERGVVELLAE